MSAPLPDCPQSLKSIQHFIKIASEHDARDPVVAYWCRLHALQEGLKLEKPPEAKKFLMALMDLLEETKGKYKEIEAISNEVVAQAHLENCALRLFKYADDEDHKQNYGKNIVKAFYTAGMIYDVLTEFGPLSEEAAQNGKYAKWKAAYIHNCLKNGQTPVPGPAQSDDNTSDQTNDNSGGSTLNQPQNPGTTSNLTPPASLSIPSSSGNTLLDPNDAIRAASQLPPVPYTPDPNPGGFIPYEPSQYTNLPQPPKYVDNTSVAQLTPEQVTKAQKYCKWAASALMYDDFKTAITNLRNALELLQTGKDPA